VRNLGSQRTSPGVGLLVVLGGLLLVGYAVSLVWPWIVGAAVIVIVSMLLRSRRQHG